MQCIAVGRGPSHGHREHVQRTFPVDVWTFGFRYASGETLETNGLTDTDQYHSTWHPSLRQNKNGIITATPLETLT